jgi:DNA polymerase-3 subunit delta'
LAQGDARFLAALTQTRLGEALETDLASARETQRQFAGLLSPASLESVSSVLAVAEALHREDRASEALEWLARWIRDLILVRLGADPASLVNLDRVSALQEAARSADTDCLLAVMDEIEAFQRAAHRNLNLQLALESILLRLRDALIAPAGTVGP